MSYPIYITNILRTDPGPCRLVQSYSTHAYCILPLGHAIPDSVRVIGGVVHATPQDAADAAHDDADMWELFNSRMEA